MRIGKVVLRCLQLMGMLARLQLLSCDLKLLCSRLHVLRRLYLLLRCLQGWLGVDSSLLLRRRTQLVSHLLRAAGAP